MSLRISLPYPVRNVILKSIGQGESWDMEENQEELLDDNEENELQMLKNRIYALETSLQNARQEAFQMGFEEGQKAVEKKYRQAIEQVPRQMAEAINNLQNQYQTAIAQLEQPMVELVLTLVDKILKYHLEFEERQIEFLKQQINYFLQQVQDDQQITIYLAPSQMQYTREPGFIAIKHPKITFVENPQLQPGECLLETENFIIDGTVSGQLEQIARQLVGDQR
jgi:flagellar assembly protein FliH